MKETERSAQARFLGWLVMDCGYRSPRILPDGRWACVSQLAYTAAIIVGQVGDKTSIDDRWCYHTGDDARAALDAWSGEGEPAGWHRHPRSGRRISESEYTYDEDDKLVPVGEMYVRG